MAKNNFKIEQLIDLEEDDDNSDVCPVCFRSKMSHPTKLPCGHIFCYLCAKGAVINSPYCPLCRQAVSVKFFARPELVPTEIDVDVQSFDNQYWYYEGRNGWWIYDSQTSKDIENEYQKKERKEFELMIAGQMYVIDFEKMVQRRSNNSGITRKIKRDVMDPNNTKGVAGIRNIHRK